MYNKFTHKSSILSLKNKNMDIFMNKDAKNGKGIDSY